ncbi:MAG: hypothetical protein U1E76_04610 [Planctomycetota bacterium]
MAGRRAAQLDSPETRRASRRRATHELGAAASAEVPSASTIVEREAARKTILDAVLALGATTRRQSAALLPGLLARGRGAALGIQSRRCARV